MAIDVKVPDDVTPKQYFEEITPKIFEQVLAEAPDAGKIPFSLNCDVDGTKYGIKSEGGKFEVAQGGVQDALINIVINEQDWRDSVTGKVDMQGGFMDMNNMASGGERQAQVLKSLKGRLDVEVAKDDGSAFTCAVIFNNAESPQAKMKMKMDDYIKMNKGELNGQVAFMQGLMQVEGDMGLMMQLGQLMV